MTNLNESKRHSRSVRRLGMIASGLALALIVLWAARVLAPGRIAFVRTLGLPDSLPGYHALADSLREGLTNCRNTVALKLAALSDPARIPVSEIRPSIRRLWLPRYTANASESTVRPTGCKR